MKNIYEVASSNKRKSFFVVLAFVVFVAVSLYFMANAYALYLGYQPGGLGIVGFALIISGLMGLSGYYFSDRIILGISGARPADRVRDFNFYTVAENLSIGAGLPMPKLYVIEDSAMNAFATGRDPKHAVICVTTGLLKKLNRTELEGVVAHELAHIKNYDIRLMSIVSVLVGSVALIADFLLRESFIRRDHNSKGSGAIFLFIGLIFAIFAPIIAQIIQLAISRRREFMADAGSVEITRQPAGLISALQKISSDHEPLEAANKATAHLYIANPFKDKARGGVAWFSSLFNTHPPIERRIAALKQMM
ncbi:MAG: M48 family metallopeptidase [Patescibacteria group bacterium]|nr:M48 family metallopeptidase [Patescibacteria group bacterium]